MVKQAILASVVLASAALRADYAPEPWNLAAREKFAAQRFGIFIHWGIYANYAQGEDPDKTSSIVSFFESLKQN